MSDNKEHVAEIEKSNFNRQRSSTEVLRKNCKEGYIFTKKGEATIKSGVNAGKTYKFVNAAGQSAFHHVLPVTTLQDGNINVDDDVLQYIHNLMAATTWDINEEPNLIGLPLKPVYMSADRAINNNKALSELTGLDPQQGAFGALPDLPCHQIEHNIYIDKVVDYLHRTIWKKLKAPKPCTDQSECLKGRLDAASKKFRKWLQARGKQEKGAAYCWFHRDEIPDSWYIPLSMCVGVPQKREPPPKLPSRNQKQWLQELFSKL
jgi:hypothetical protein